jgi:hypothetical protein
VSFTILYLSNTLRVWTTSFYYIKLVEAVVDQIVLHGPCCGDVANGVMALSQDQVTWAHVIKFKRKWLQLEDSVTRIKLQPMEVWMVKLADRITNLQPTRHL